MKAVIHRHTLIGFWASLVGWIGAMSYAYTYGSEQVGAGLSLVAYLLMIPVYVVVISIANALGCLIGTGIFGGKGRAEPSPVLLCLLRSCGSVDLRVFCPVSPYSRLRFFVPCMDYVRGSTVASSDYCP